ncbi:hypothetical protein [Vibrio phage BONAISHI]|nr:hypothetical protein [Vibrio phage BONAISHI]
MVDKTKTPEELYSRLWPKVRESDFYDIYLPLLLDSSSPEGRMRWIDEIAKKAVMRVNVVDDNDHDNILFWVPPVINTFDTVKHRGFQDVALVYNNEANRLSSDIAAIKLSRELDNRIIAQDTPQEHLDQWKMILNRKGIAMPGQEEETIAEEKEVKSDVSDNDFQANW